MLTRARARLGRSPVARARAAASSRSEEHTSELQSRQYLVCRLLLEKKRTLPEARTTTPKIISEAEHTRCLLDEKGDTMDAHANTKTTSRRGITALTPTSD